MERNGKPTGYVIHAKDSAVHVATGDMVQVDLGREDGLAPGDFLTAFVPVIPDRKHVMPDYHYKYGNQIYARPDLHDDDGRDAYPDLPVAQMVVVTAEPDADGDVGIDYERRLLYLAFSSEDAREGMTAFVEKRSPQFEGR